MNILITGGAGFLGINLIRYLLKQGHKITSLDIAEFDYDDVKNKIIISKGDIRNENTVNNVMKNQDIVVHTAAALPLYTKEKFFLRIKQAQKFCSQAAFNNKIKRFIHISSPRFMEFLITPTL